MSLFPTRILALSDVLPVCALQCACDLVLLRTAISSWTIGAERTLMEDMVPYVVAFGVPTVICVLKGRLLLATLGIGGIGFLIWFYHDVQQLSGSGVEYMGVGIFFMLVVYPLLLIMVVAAFLPPKPWSVWPGRYRSLNAEAKRHVGRARSNLEPTERVLDAMMIRPPMHRRVPGVLIATDTRLFFRFKGLGRPEPQSYPYETIDSVEYETTRLFGTTLRFQSSGRRIVFSDIWSDHVEAFVTTLKSKVDEQVETSGPRVRPT